MVAWCGVVWCVLYCVPCTTVYRTMTVLWPCMTILCTVPCTKSCTTAFSWCSYLRRFSFGSKHTGGRIGEYSEANILVSLLWLSCRSHDLECHRTSIVAYNYNANKTPCIYLLESVKNLTNTQSKVGKWTSWHHFAPYIECTGFGNRCWAPSSSILVRDIHGMCGCERRFCSI